ncbi:MAG: NAD-dependent epimerase/dehydratase family protein [Spirochaetota bacterium]
MSAADSKQPAREPGLGDGRIDASKEVVITGGAGFLGARVASLLLERYPGARLTLTDITDTSRLEPLLRSQAAADGRVVFAVGDLSDQSFVDQIITDECGTVFHLASLVSGGAERDFQAGLQANVFATINLLEALRLRAEKPRFVFTSSIATYGGSELPKEIDDWTFQHPQNSYGVAKVLGEQLLNDYSRKGFLSGRGVRLPAITVRDVANTAASGYASTMVREALAGRDYACPVSPETRIPIMGADTAVSLLVALAELPDTALGDYRTVNGHGVSPTAAEIAEAVVAASPAGRPLGAITFAPDPAIESIVAAWPRAMHATRADKVGLPADTSVRHIIDSYLASLSRNDA